jgi:hypothetical protein
VTIWQLVKTLRARLVARTWPDSPNEPVFPVVVVTAAAWASLMSNRRTPLVAIRPGKSDGDAESLDLTTQSIDFMILVAVEGDEVGQNAMIGGNRSGGQGSSRGRGLLEVEEELEAVLQSMVQSGYRFTFVSASDTEGIETDAGTPYAVHRVYTWEVPATRTRFYHPPANLVATGGVGSVTLAWTLPPDRYDRRQIVLRRAAGATAPTGPTDGTGVTLAGDLATSVVDTVAVGTYSYAIFCGYTETGAATNERYSSAATGTTRLSVVVT